MSCRSMKLPLTGFYRKFFISNQLYLPTTSPHWPQFWPHGPHKNRFNPVSIQQPLNIRRKMCTPTSPHLPHKNSYLFQDFFTWEGFQKMTFGSLYSVHRYLLKHALRTVLQKQSGQCQVLCLRLLLPLSALSINASPHWIAVESVLPHPVLT